MTDEKDECFETETGVPTLTIETAGEIRMFPYSSFRHATLKEDRITVELFEWEIIIHGKQLNSLWRQLQMQDLRVIRPNPGALGGSCAISSIEVSRTEEDA